MLNYLVNKRTKLIWGLAWPVMVSQILQTLLGIGDMWFISNLGVNEAAATGISTSVLGVIIVFSQLIAVGAIALISRKIGEGDEEGALPIAEQALVLALFVGIIILSACLFYTENILKIFGADTAVENHASTYLKIVLMGIPFMFFNLTGRAVLQAKGDTKTPMIIFIFMNLINIALDPILIYGWSIFPKLGLGGAALATAISNVVAFVLMIYFIQRKLFNNSMAKVINNFRLNIHTIGRILKIGFFSAIQAISRPITGLLMYRVANYSGTEAVAAFGIGGRVLELVFIFLMGLSTAISVLTGQNLGKRDLEGAENVISDGIKLAIINMILFAIPYFIFAKYIIFAFNQDPQVVAIGTNYLRIVYVGVVFVVFPMVYGGAFMGAGDTAPPMVASLVANWIFKLPLAYILSEMAGMGANGVWLAISISVVSEAVIIYFWFKKGKWKEKKI